MSVLRVITVGNCVGVIFAAQLDVAEKGKREDRDVLRKLAD